MGEYADAIINRMIDGGQFRGRRSRPRKPPVPTCPKCGKKATRTDTQWGERYDHCGLTAWGRKPLQDRATLAARQYAHTIFDSVWRKLGVSRGEAYRRLAERMGLHPSNCHMALMTREQAEAVPDHARAIWHEIRQQRKPTDNIR